MEAKLTSWNRVELKIPWRGLSSAGSVFPFSYVLVSHRFKIQYKETHTFSYVLVSHRTEIEYKETYREICQKNDEILFSFPWDENFSVK